MGASCSIIQGNHDQSIPVELIIKILFYLPFPDLISCRRVNHALNAIITSSPHIQHLINTDLAGVVDNPNASLDLLERRRALELRHQAWDSYEPQHVITSNVSHFYNFIQNGIYFKFNFVNAHADSISYRWPPGPKQCLDDGWSCLSPLPRQGDYSIIVLAVCLEENDLVAVGMDIPTLIPTSDYYTYEVDLLCFSSGGGKHPSAREPTLFLNGSSWTRRQMEMEIRKDLLAVLFTDELLVFDWKTAQNIASLKDRGISAFRFLSDKVMVVANKATQSLDLFTLPEPHGDTSQTTMMKVTSLGLPHMAPLDDLEFRNLPAKNGVPRSTCQLDNAAVYVKPFTESPESIIYVVFEELVDHLVYSPSFVVHSSALLYHVPFTSPASLQNNNYIPWSKWGPTITRWSDDEPSHAFQICGQRWFVGGPLRSLREIWDFNQYRVKQLGQGFAVETETAHISVVTEVSHITRLEGFKDGKSYVSSSLPYVKIVPKQRQDYTFWGLDDDRIYAARWSWSSGFLSGETDQLYFG